MNTIHKITYDLARVKTVKMDRIRVVFGEKHLLHPNEVGIDLKFKGSHIQDGLDLDSFAPKVKKELKEAIENYGGEKKIIHEFCVAKLAHLQDELEKSQRVVERLMVERDFFSKIVG